MSGSSSRKIAVIGGGISGLTAAWTLMRQSGCAVHLFEATNRLGGTLETHRIEEFLVEQSADMFTTDEPDALDLCSSLGIADQLINTNEADRRAFICWQGVLQPVPHGFAMMSPTDLDSIRETPLLSDAGKQRFLEEADIPPRADCDGEGVSITDESLQCFATRRFGVEAFERLIQPLIGGIYTADPEHLSMLATMKKYVEQERMYGSLIQAAKEAPTPADSATQGAGARYGRFVAPQGGMQALVDALANSLQAAGSQV